MNDRRAYVDDLAERFRRAVEDGLDELESMPATMDQIEELVERLKIQFGQELEQEILRRQPDEPANHVACIACSGRARFHSVSPRRLLSWHGEPELSRRWFRCGCGASFAPLDLRLGLDTTATTPRVRQQIAAWAADRPFAAVAQDLHSSRGLTISESTVERVAVACGERLRRQSEQAAAAYAAETGEAPVGETAPAVGAPATPSQPLHRPKTVYLSMDGVYAPFRDAWKKDGSEGKLTCRHGECKVGMVYALEFDRQGRPRVAWREYVATFQDIHAFRPQMAALAHRCGVETAERQVFLADTLACNWTLASDCFPDAVQIVDWRHAVSHLETVAEAFYGTDTAPGQRWLSERKAELWEGQAAQVAAAIADLPELPRETAVQTETRRREAEYFQNHRERMRYAYFRAEGYQIGSGVMEASCRTVVNQRLDCSGMHWRPETADAMVALRAALLSSTRPAPRSYCLAN